MSVRSAIKYIDSYHDLSALSSNVYTLDFFFRGRATRMTQVNWCVEQCVASFSEKLS